VAQGPEAGPCPFEAALKQPSVRFAVACKCVGQDIVWQLWARRRLVPESAADEAFEMVTHVLLVE
jgi:hypothetical protein